MGSPISLVGGDVGSEGSTELRKATGSWMGLGLEQLEVGEDTWGGDWARKAGAGGLWTGEGRKVGGLDGDCRTRVGNCLGNIAC